MPIWLSVLGALVVMSFLGFEIWVWATADSTTIIVVRHAEKEAGGGDPPLSPAGLARAELLGRMFGDVRAPGRIDAIYVSPTVRSQMTAASRPSSLRRMTRAAWPAACCASTRAAGCWWSGTAIPSPKSSSH